MQSRKMQFLQAFLLKSTAVVYCSTRVLSQKEKENFFWFHKNDFAHVQYFQYSDEAIFQEFLHCVPERARNYLEAEALVLGLRET